MPIDFFVVFGGFGRGIGRGGTGRRSIGAGRGGRRGGILIIVGFDPGLLKLVDVVR